MLLYENNVLFDKQALNVAMKFATLHLIFAFDEMLCTMWVIARMT